MRHCFALRNLQADSFIKRYVVAIASVLVALVLRSILHPILGEKSQYTVFLLSVVFTAWSCGSVPALFALALGAFLGNFFFVEPSMALRLEGLSDGIAVTFYALVGIAIVYLFEVLKRRQAQLDLQISRQAEVEAALRISEDRFRLATEALRGLMYDANTETAEVYRSEGLYELIGYHPSEVPQNRQWWYEQVNPDDLLLIRKAFDQSVARRAPTQSDEYRIRHKDGRSIWVWDNFRILYNAEGKPIRKIGTTVSIDESRKLTESLASSEERFRLVTEALQGAIYDWDARTDVAYRSPAIFDLVGYERQEVGDTRKWWQNLIHPDDFSRVLETFDKRVAEHAPIHSIEYRVRHKDGHYIWVWDKSRVIYDEAGKLIRLIGCTLSIDEQIRLSESLTLSEERFSVAFENAGDAMALSDSEGVIVAANDAYCNLYGYSREEIIGNNFAIIFPEAKREQNLATYRKVFHQQYYPPDYESIVQRKDGTRRIVESRVGFVTLGGKSQYMLSVVRDLTERKRTEDELYARYKLTVDLGQAVDVEDVAKVALDHLMERIGAAIGTVYAYDAGENRLELLYANADLITSGALNGWQQFTANPNLPMTDVVKNNKALWFSSIGEYEDAYPAIKQYVHVNRGATVILPLMMTAEVFGAMSLLFYEPRVFSETERAFITSLVDQCAQALERARLADKGQALAVLEERHRLARDLHDNVSQLLFSSSVISEMLPRLLTTKPDKAVKQAEDLHLMVRGAMAEMRTLLWELRPESIIQTKLSGLLTQLAYAAESRQEGQVTLKINAPNETMLPPDVQIAFYRVAQESIHNVFKHGRGANLSIRMRQNERYTALIISDDGQGFDTGTTSAGFGLRNMGERAAGVDGRFDIQSRAGKGTRIRLLWTL